MEEKTKYYLLKQKAVPEVLLKVAEAKKLIASEKAMTIQEATDQLGISRSSFYKYKDDIFPFYDNAKRSRKPQKRLKRNLEHLRKSLRNCESAHF